jgi:hypothetical protein
VRIAVAVSVLVGVAALVAVAVWVALGVAVGVAARTVCCISVEMVAPLARSKRAIMTCSPAAIPEVLNVADSPAIGVVPRRV